MQALEPPAPPVAEYDKLCIFRLADEPAGRDVADESPVHPHVGVELLPAGEPFPEYLVPFVAVDPPIHTQDGKDSDVAPGVQCD